MGFVCRASFILQILVFHVATSGLSIVIVVGLSMLVNVFYFCNDYRNISCCYSCFLKKYFLTY